MEVSVLNVPKEPFSIPIEFVLLLILLASLSIKMMAHVLAATQAMLLLIKLVF